MAIKRPSFFENPFDKAQGKGFHLPRLEEKVLEFWKNNQIFEKSLALRQTKNLSGDKRYAIRHKRPFVFFEGPPTANGHPGIHHVLARAFKDIICRYKTMRGFYVPRKSGWDTHGLPVELAVEKELGLASKRDIEKYGIAEFNRKCRDSAWRYKDEWERLTERMGFWLDLKHPYITYENRYIETLWWILKKFWEKKLLYEGYKVVPWCARCGTSLSSHELGQPGAYREVTEDSVYAKFKIQNSKFKEPTYILSWTTTPWTLPGNVALAVGKKISYTALRVKGVKGLYIVASELARYVFKDEEIEIVHDDIKGKDLVGLRYEPLFKIKALQTETTHKVYPADFVTTIDGTGVVHTAVMYGEDDYRLGVHVGLPQHHTVDETGRFTDDVPDMAGLSAKPKDIGEQKKTNQRIFDHLKANNTLLRVEEYTHDYPHCWRCDTPLLYYARASWFVAMSRLKAQLLKENKSINWVPEHFKEGRFGEWLKDVKDWNFSRERYWGTPLPVWKCEKCGHADAIGSRKELGARAVPIKNEYIAMRHAFPETVMLGIIDSGQGEYHLTPSGKKSLRAVAAKLKKEKIDLIIASDILRTKETAKIVGEYLGAEVHYDKRIREIYLAEYSGKPNALYRESFPTYEDRFSKAPEGGESLTDVRRRVFAALQDLENKYSGKKILLISHEYTIWMMAQVARGWSDKQAIAEKRKCDAKKRESAFISPAQFIPLHFVSGPRDATGLYDMHRPYIDAVKISCKKCGASASRVKEVCDVWFDSGSMPLAQFHFPFESQVEGGRYRNIDMSKFTKNPKGFLYPADYISEAADQTRGWFYTLLAVATALGMKAPYKNVVCLGLINDKHGKKMSKSRGNIVSPWDIMEKHGIDAARWYLYTVNPPGEPKNFDEAELAKSFRKFHMIIYNSLVFWQTYADSGATFNIQHSTFSNVLDRWILVRLSQTTADVTAKLDAYEVRDAALAIEVFADDLSRWYIRRSRRRFQKPESAADYRAASATLGYVLNEVSKLLAPFTPFFAEGLYRATRGKEESVHLAEWTVCDKRQATSDKELLAQMEMVRAIASIALARRAEIGVKVRQPLQSLKISAKGGSLLPPGFGRADASGGKYQPASPKGGRSKIGADLLEILKDEVNVKEIIFDKKMENELELDATITEELREEGVVREFLRAVAELRSKADLKPKNEVRLFIESPPRLAGILGKNEKLVKKEANAKGIEYKRAERFDAETEGETEGGKFWLALKKI